MTMKNFSKEKIFGIIGTFLFHVLLFLILYFMILDRPEVVKEQSFVEQMAEDPEEEKEAEEFLEKVKAMSSESPKETDAGGHEKPDQPAQKESVETPTPPQPSPKSAPVIKSPQEPVSVKETPKASEVKPEPKVEPEKTEVKETPKPKYDVNDLLNKKPGNQPEKNEDQKTPGNALPSTVTGVGVSFNDGSDRGYISLPKPSVKSGGNCRVVVDIVVDADGNVTSAKKGTGTDTSDPNLVNAAINKAKEAKFNKGNGNHKGKITYNFKVN